MGIDPSPDLWGRLQWLEAEILRLLPDAACNEPPEE